MPKIEVSLCDILEYIGERSRPLKEGEAVFKAGHIILCGVEETSKNIKSLCLQTSSLTSQPHEITLTLGMNVKNWNCVCSCKAGLSGFCKHIVGTLIYINRHEDLELVSCTDLTQKWGKEKKGLEESHKIKPFKEFCHPVSKRQKIIFNSSQELDKENFALLSTGVGDSALTKFLSRSSRPMDLPKEGNSIPTKEVEVLICHSKNSIFLRTLKQEISLDSFSLRPCCQEILKSLSLSNILAVATHKQGSSEWFRERQIRITGSTCYSIVTFKEENWENKSKKIFFPKHFENKFTRYGKQYEKEAREAFQRQHKCHLVTPGLIVSELFPWLGFSPDAVIFEDNIPSVLLEVKCPYIGRENPPETFVESCDYLQKSGDEIKLKEKHQYYGQVQLGMSLLGLPKTKLVLYSSCTKTFLEINVEFDKTFSESLIKKITENYFNKMLHFYCINKDSSA